VARLLSPEGVLVGITFTPWMHKDQDDSGADGAGDDDGDDDDGEDQPGA
jgi:hypothetical protein